MKHSIGDRWINYIMKQTVKVDTRGLETIFFALAGLQVLLFVFRIFNGQINTDTFVLAAMSFLIGVTTFERRKFTHIIREQKQEIHHLRASLAEDSLLDEQSSQNVIKE